MAKFITLIESISKAMLLVAALMVAAMMLIVLVDVISRALFELTSGGLDITFIGGIELVRFALLFAILYALPWNLDRSQIFVDLFTGNLSDRAISILTGLSYLGYFFLAMAMTYRFFDSLGMARMTGETTQDLGIPMPIIYAGIIFGTCMLGVRSLQIAGRNFREAVEVKL